MDPFSVVKKEVEFSAENGGALLKKLASPGGAQDERSVNEFKMILRNIEADLNELQDTIRIVEMNPSKFKLDKVEIASRKAFVESTRSVVTGWKGEFTAILNKIDKTILLARKTPAAAPASPYKSNTEALHSEQAVQQLILEQQDAKIDSVLTTVGNLKEVAMVMGNELEDQSRLLDEMEHNVDSTAGKLNSGMKRLNEFILANGDNRQGWCVVILVVILLILIALVIAL